MSKCLTLCYAPLFLIQSLRSYSKCRLSLAVVYPLRYLNTSIDYTCNLICFKYLGSQVAANGGCERDVVHRMNEGYRAWGAFERVLI